MGPSFPNSSSGDPQKVSEEKGLEPSGVRSKSKAFGGLVGEIGRGFCCSVPEVVIKRTIMGILQQL